MPDTLSSQQQEAVSPSAETVVEVTGDKGAGQQQHVFNEQTNYVPRSTIITVSSPPTG
jgi:hypothetical protein